MKILIDLQNKIVKVITNKESTSFQAGISLILRISNRLTAFIITWLLAVFWGPDELGVYSYIFSIISILSIVSQFGLPDIVIREVSSRLIHDDWGRLKGIVIWALGFSFCLTLLLIGLCFLAIRFIPNLNGSLYTSAFFLGFRTASDPGFIGST